MLNTAIVKQVHDFVYQQPRSILEIASLLHCSWLTADRYVKSIAEHHGSIQVKVFRGGTRGALKIVYWNSTEGMKGSETREWLLRRIETGRKKEDFSPSEIFQFIDPTQKKLQILTEQQFHAETTVQQYMQLLQSAQSQVLFFSGNLTFSNYQSQDHKILSILEDLAMHKIQTSVLTRVDLPGFTNVQNVLAINHRVGRNHIEVRHCFQPLRATIIDTKVALLREKFSPSNYAPGELTETQYCLYYIYDPEWITWLQKVFWGLFRKSVDAEKRIEDLQLST
ncbi:hypothetical protein HZB00_03315 [Candidatus Woesearchaeota archaeon]|nr:hypothetical protein [Candidatus Woesearchaeota archaeon]